MSEYVKVIEKNKGAFKNFLKKLEQVQDFKATCGIHKNDGRRIVRHQNLKKPRNNSSLKVDKKDSGKISDAKDRSKSKRKKNINSATLSSILERRISWHQSKTAVFTPANGGDNIAIRSNDTLIHVKPARIFIHLEKVENVWAEVKQIVQNECMLYLTKLEYTHGGMMLGRNLFKELS